MEAYKKEFIDFMVESDVLKFGEFTLKSGRKSPFFMNAGAYVTGSQLKRLGEYYAKAIHDTYGDDFDVLFGPAYKGIPISVVTAIAYSELYGKEIRYCSDRKEEKDHGADKGSFLGSKLKDGDRVVMIEDVTTSGKSMEETVPKVRSAADVEIVGLMVSLNRMEVGKGGEKSALDEIQEEYGFKANAIVSMADVVEYLYNKECNGKVVIDDTIKTNAEFHEHQSYETCYGSKAAGKNGIDRCINCIYHSFFIRKPFFLLPGKSIQQENRIVHGSCQLKYHCHIIGQKGHSSYENVSTTVQQDGYTHDQKKQEWLRPGSSRNT